MKKLKLFLAFFLMVLTGCEKDFLDKAPEMGLTEEDIFSEFESARGYLDQAYPQLHDIHNWDYQNLKNHNITSLSDETATMVLDGPGGDSMLRLNAGEWLDMPGYAEVGWNGGDGNRSPVLSRAFDNIRVMNKVIAKAPNIPNVTEEELNGLLGQAHFLRGWFYFQIIKRWGGMPILDEAYTPSSEMDLKRLTYQESTEWIISDMEQAFKLLPHIWEDAQRGRPTKASALALKEMAALYAASPLMKNGLNTIQNSGYDIAWAERAAEYAHEAIEYVENGTGGHTYRLMSGEEYNNIFYHVNYTNPEALWYQVARNRNWQDIRGLYLPRRIENAGGKGHRAVNYSNPTQNIVDLFETMDGYPITHPASNYDPQNPYANRDPRLENNILVPGEQWGLNNGNKPLYIETYVGGEGFNQARNFPVSSSRMISGYVNKKFIWPEANGYTDGADMYTYNTVYIRVSQLYLDYAEAMNAAYGPTADPKGYGLTAVGAINIIRNRVGMPNVRSEFTASKAEFMKRIRNERAVELMFENHRWFDLRRWMIAEEVFKEPIKGIRAIPPAGHKQVQDKSSLDFTYEVVELTPEQRVFTTRYYWYPVPLDHVNNLYNFQQNPGW